MGDKVFKSAGDRGDASMYSWGASLYALTSGNQETAKVLWPAIQWCQEYTQRKITKDGVVASNSGEIESRVKSGNANPSTSCLTYRALTNAALLTKGLNEPQCIIDKYSGIASNLRTAFENYLGADIDGYHNYRYYVWAPNIECDFYNQAGLPALPFRTDGWKLNTAKKVYDPGEEFLKYFLK